MTIPRVHFSPPLSRTAASSHSPGGHSFLFAVAAPDLTSKCPGSEVHMKSVQDLGHSSGGDASIHRAVERRRPERDGVCRPLLLTHIRGLETRPVLCGRQGASDLFVSDSRTELLPLGSGSRVRIPSPAPSESVCSQAGRRGFESRHPVSNSIAV